VVSYVCCFFFFQAEDGIRDFHVTGVQTCTLPICRRCSWRPRRRTPRAGSRPARPARRTSGPDLVGSDPPATSRPRAAAPRSVRKIGRASCRERVEITVVGGAAKQKKTYLRKTWKR